MSPYLPRPAVAGLTRLLVKNGLRIPPRIARPLLNRLAVLTPLADGVVERRQTLGGVPGTLFVADGSGETPAAVYLHGGAYVAGSPATQRSIASYLAQGTGSVFSVDYRLAPEHTYPAAHEDALAAYRVACEEAGGPVMLAGDSAGGALALATAVAARDEGLPVPRAVVLVSPWIDQTMSGRSYAENRRSDAMLIHDRLKRNGEAYRGELAADDPAVSPLFADLHGLPPILVQAGGGELLLSDAESLASRATDAGVEVELDVYPDLWHEFQSSAGLLREADEALESMRDWAAARLA